MRDQEDLAKYRDEAFAVFNRYGIAKIVVHFDGSGDSGQIEDIKFSNALDVPEDFYEKTAVDLPWVSHQDTIGGYENGQYFSKKNPNPPNLRELAETLADKVLEESQYDWYNNDGGWGEIIMIPAEGVLHLDMNIRIQSSENYPEDYGTQSLDAYEDGELFTGAVTQEGSNG